MNKLILTTALLLSAAFLNAQSTTHTLSILKDDPNAVSDHLIGLNGCHAQFSKREHLKAGLGVEVLWSLGTNLQFQGSGMFYYLAIRNAQGPDISAEGGVALTLSSRTGQRNVKIVLSHKEDHYDTPTEHVRTSETKYLNATGSFLSKTKVRTGLYFKKAGMDGSDEMGAGIAAYTGVGLYGGIEFSRQACLFSEVDKTKGVTSGYTRFYIDGLFLPVSKFETTTGRDPGKIGFRVGYEAFFNPNKKNNAEYGKLVHYQVYPSLFWKIETGISGAEGWFFNMGLGFLVHKNK